MKHRPDIEKGTPETFERLKADERRWQDEIGNNLIEQSYQCAGSRFVYERQFERILSRITGKPDSSLLQIGCGRGQFLNKTAEAFESARMRLYGLDISSGLVEVKRKYGKKIDWIVGDGENLPFPDRIFDFIVYNGSLHHMPDFRRALHEAFRVMRLDGHIILYEPISTFFSRTIHHLLDPFVFKKTQYESPVDIYCKDNFRFEHLHSIIIEAGYTYDQSWHDFIAYPLTGCYSGSYFSKKAGLMKALMGVEESVQRIPFVGNISNFFCWRVLVDIYRN
jgi:SAM-dependent methyltransferase